MEKGTEALSADTKLAHDEGHAEGAIAPPIYQSSLFAFDSYEAMVDRYRGGSQRAVYSRIDNPTTDVFQKKVTELEGADAARAFSSGMAAISNAILSIVNPGDRVVCVKHVYPDTYRLLRGLCARFNIATDFVDGTDNEAVEACLPGARLLYLESPNSWMMEEQDIAALATMARAGGVITIADNSWATPINQRPLELGVDMVVHSASKYLSGHSDTVAGVVTGSHEAIETIDQEVRPYLGACLSPHNAALLIRGLRTLPVRMQRHNDSGLLIAGRLSDHPAVTTVCHPGLHQAAFSALSGYGGLFSIVLHDSVDIPSFCNALSIFRLGVSWGGYESLAVPCEAGRSQVGEFNSAIDFGVPSRMVRLFIGLEDPEDLWTDLVSALDTAKAAGTE